MRKRKTGRTLSRPKNQRIALLRTLLVSLTEHGRITTTLAKAKEFRPFAERMITRAKKGVEKESRVSVLRKLKEDVPAKTAKKLIELAEVFAGRNGGYVRIVKLPFRKSDGADMAMVEWTQQLENENSKPEEKKTEKKKGDQNEIKKEKGKEEK